MKRSLAAIALTALSLCGASAFAKDTPSNYRQTLLNNATEDQYKDFCDNVPNPPPQAGTSAYDDCIVTRLFLLEISNGAVASHGCVPSGLSLKYTYPSERLNLIKVVHQYATQGS